MRQTDKPETPQPLGSPLKIPPTQKPPEQVSPGVLRGHDGKLYTNIPLGPVA